MHELALSQGIVDLVATCAKREQVARVSRVLIEIGTAAAVDPQALEFCFPLVAAGTVAEGAELAIRHVDLRLRCGSCGHEYASEHVIARCPMCGSGERSILAGREMRVVSFEAC